MSETKALYLSNTFIFPVFLSLFPFETKAIRTNDISTPFILFDFYFPLACFNYLQIIKTILVLKYSSWPIQGFDDIRRV